MPGARDALGCHREAVILVQALLLPKRSRVGEELVNHLPGLSVKQRDFSPDFFAIIGTSLHQGLNIEMPFRDFHLDEELSPQAFEHPCFPHQEIVSLWFLAFPKGDPKALVFIVSFIQNPLAFSGVFIHLTERDYLITTSLKSRALDQPIVALILVLFVLLVGHNLVTAWQVALVVNVLNQGFGQEALAGPHAHPACGAKFNFKISPYIKLVLREF